MMEASELAENKDASIRALGLILCAWEEGADSGVAPELMAYAGEHDLPPHPLVALTDLVAAFGEEAVASMATGLAGRVIKGEFSLQPSAAVPHTKQ